MSLIPNVPKGQTRNTLSLQECPLGRRTTFWRPFQHRSPPPRLLKHLLRAPLTNQKTTILLHLNLPSILSFNRRDCRLTRLSQSHTQ